MGCGCSLEGVAFVRGDETADVLQSAVGLPNPTGISFSVPVVGGLEGFVAGEVALRVGEEVDAVLEVLRVTLVAAFAGVAPVFSPEILASARRQMCGAVERAIIEQGFEEQGDDGDLD